MSDFLKEFTDFDISDWNHDRFRIMTMVSLILKDIPGLDYIIKPGQLYVDNLSVVDDSTKEKIICLQKIVETTSLTNANRYIEVLQECCPKDVHLPLVESLQEKLERIQADVISAQETAHTHIVFVRKDRGSNIDYYQKRNFDISKILNW